MTGLENLSERIRQLNQARIETLREYQEADRQFGSASREAFFFYGELMNVTKEYHELINERNDLISKVNLGKPVITE